MIAEPGRLVQRLRGGIEPFVLAPSWCLHLSGTNYTTLMGGEHTFQINYIDPVSGGYIVGTFNGSMQDALGSSATVSGGSTFRSTDLSHTLTLCCE